ncbi:MAG: carbohydrate ABC transporter permease [Candidatus Eisenbacteria sp.]|nr:carbohydrate ABC transporter permease [Candidatus Eisenbacteria bacterium]
MKRILIILALVFFVLTTLIPLVWMVSLSVRGEGTVLRGVSDLLPRQPTLDHYREVWAGGAFARFFLNSSIVATLVVAGNLVFASMVAYGLARFRTRGSKLVMGTVLGMLMIPKQVTMVPLYVLMARLGLIDSYWALTLPFLVDALNIFLVYQFLQTVPPDLEDAARIDGAGEAVVFFRIVMPLLAPVLAVVGINTFLLNWNSFLYPFILTASEHMRTLPVGLALYAQGQYSIDWGSLMAGSVLSVIPVLVVFFLFQRQIVSGLTAGAVKG